MATTEIDFFNPIPPTFNPTIGRTQWVETLPNFTLPNGKIWIPNRGEYTIPEVMAKGANTISKYEFVGISSADRIALENAGKTYAAVERPEHFFGLTPTGDEDWVNDGYGVLYNKRWWPTGPLTQEQAIEKANATELTHALRINETEEGQTWVAPDHPMWGWYYTRLAERTAAKWDALGKPWYISHNYFTFNPLGWFGLGYDTRETHISKYERPFSEWEPCRYSPGRPLAATNLVCLAVYLNEPGDVLNDMFSLVYKALCYKKMGKHTSVFLFGRHEWGPNNRHSMTFPHGTLYRNDKLSLDPQDMMSYDAIGSCYCQVMTEWGGHGKNTATKVGKQWINDDYYIKAGQVLDTGQYAEWDPVSGFEQKYAVDFPDYDKYGTSVRVDTQGSNYFAYGMHMYAQTMGQVAGGTRTYLKHRINGGEWITPLNEIRAVVNACYDNGYLIFSDQKDGKIGFAIYHAGRTGNLRKTIEWQHPTDPSRIYKAEIGGRGARMVLLND
jgi:hypothetical protein